MNATIAELSTKMIVAMNNLKWAVKLEDETLIAAYRKELADLRNALNNFKVGA